MHVKLNNRQVSIKYLCACLPIFKNSFLTYWERLYLRVGLKVEKIKKEKKIKICRKKLDR